MAAHPAQIEDWPHPTIRTDRSEEANMAKPFNGGINLDIRDSTPDWDAFLPDNAPDGAPNVLVVLF
jgi:hypothetical protein